MWSPQHRLPIPAIRTTRRVPLRPCRQCIFSLIHKLESHSLEMEGKKKPKQQKIAETCTLIHGLDSGGYNSELFGILLRKLKAAHVDVISNKEHVDFCAWLVPRSFHDTVYLVWAFWWLAMASAGTSICRLLRGLLWTVSRCPAEGNAVKTSTAVLPYIPRQSRETRHSVSYGRYRSPAFDLSSFKTEILFWLILHIIQYRRLNIDHFSMYNLSKTDTIKGKPM